MNSPLLQSRIISWTKFKYVFFFACFPTHKLQLPKQKIVKIPLAVGHLLTNKMSREIVLNLNIVVIFCSIMIDKYSLEVVREKPSVGSQVKSEMSTLKGKKKIGLNSHHGSKIMNQKK